MYIRGLTKLNIYKQTIIPVCLFCIFIWCFLFYLIYSKGLLPDRFVIPSLLISFAILFIVQMIYFFSFKFKVEEVLVPHVLSNFPDWEFTRKRQRNIYKYEPWREDLLPPENFIYNSILPDYEAMFEVIDAFSDHNKTIAQVEYIDMSGSFSKKPTYLSTLIVIKTSKKLESTTYFKTNNYPKKTNKHILQEKEKNKLPKIELENTANNFDVYSNDKNIAENLATQELFTALQNIKEQLNLSYVKAIFHDDYIVLVLRHPKFSLFNYSTFFVTVPFFKNINYVWAEQAVHNFGLLTDLANKAEEFTKNV